MCVLISSCMYSHSTSYIIMLDDNISSLEWGRRDTCTHVRIPTARGTGWYQLLHIISIGLVNQLYRQTEAQSSPAGGLVRPIILSTGKIPAVLLEQLPPSLYHTHQTESGMTHPPLLRWSLVLLFSITSTCDNTLIIYYYLSVLSLPPYQLLSAINLLYYPSIVASPL